MAIVLQQTGPVGAGNATTIASQFASNDTAGNLIVAFCVVEGGTNNTSSVTDTEGNTYHKATSLTRAGNFDVAIYYAYNIVGGTKNTVTAHDSSGPDKMVIYTREYSGIKSSADPLDQKTIAQGSSAALSSGATSTTAIAIELVVGAGCYNLNATDLTLGTGYGNLVQNADGTVDFGIEDLITSSTGAQTSAFGTGAGGTHSWICAVATFESAPTSTSTLNNHF